jgi:hypothetical protein
VIELLTGGAFLAVCAGLATWHLARRDAQEDA